MSNEIKINLTTGNKITAKFSQGRKGSPGTDGAPGAKIISVGFNEADMVFTLDDASTVVLTNAYATLKGAKGDTGAKVVSAAFVGNDIVLTLDDASTVTLTGAKLTLKGDTGATGPAGADGAAGPTGPQGPAGAAGAGGLITTYTYNSNTEIAPTAVDTGTGTFTKTAHGLNNGDRIFPVLNYNAGQIYAIGTYPTGLTQVKFYVVNKTTDTFQVSLTSGGAAVTFTGAGDLTKWHFEKAAATSISITGLSQTRMKAIVKGKFATGTEYLMPDAWYTNDGWYSSDTNNTFGTRYLVNKFGSVQTHITATFNCSVQPATAEYKGFAYDPNNTTTNTLRTCDIIKWHADGTQITTITELVLYADYIANRSTIEVYAL